MLRFRYVPLSYCFAKLRAKVFHAVKGEEPMAELFLIIALGAGSLGLLAWFVVRERRDRRSRSGMTL